MKPSRRRERRFDPALRFLLPIVGAASAWLMVSMPSAEAFDWSVKSRVSETLDYDDNVNRQAKSDGDAYGSTTDLSVDLLGVMKTWSLGIASNLSFSEFGGRGASDNQDGLQGGIDLGLDKKTRRTDYGLTASVDVQRASASEIEDSGLTTVDTERITVSVGNSISHRINHRNSLSFSLGATVVEFADENVGLTPFVDLTTSGTWSHKLTKRTVFDGSIDLEWFDADNLTETESLIGRANAGLTTQFSKRMTVQAGVGIGVVRTRSLQATGAGRSREVDTEPSVLGNLRLDYQLKRGSVSAFTSHSLSPSSLGEIQVRSTVGMGSSYRINQFSTLLLNASFTRQDTEESSESAGGNTQRDLFRISPAFSYNFARNWYASAGYTFTRQDTTAGVADSNAVYFSVSRDFVFLQ